MMNAPRAKKIFFIVALLAMIVTSVLSIYFPYSKDPSAHLVWYKTLPGFAAMLGFVSAMVMVPLVKTFAKKVLLRPDEYYAPYEDRLAQIAGQPPGTSLADPSAPSEATDEAPGDSGDPTKNEGCVHA